MGICFGRIDCAANGVNRPQIGQVPHNVLIAARPHFWASFEHQGVQQREPLALSIRGPPCHIDRPRPGSAVPADVHKAGRHLAKHPQSVAGDVRKSRGMGNAFGTDASHAELCLKSGRIQHGAPRCPEPPSLVFVPSSDPTDLTRLDISVQAF